MNDGAVRRTKSLVGRRIVVTGGSRGIGREIAQELAASGARLAIWARDEATLRRTQAELRTMTDAEVISFSCDVRDRGQICHCVEKVVAQFGGIDGLVNNAGSNGVSKLFADYADNEFEGLVQLNLLTAAHVIQAVLPALLGAQTPSIVNIASMAGKMGVPGWAGYCAAKHGMLGLTKVLAREHALAGLRVNAVCPGFVETDMMSSQKLEEWAEALSMTRRDLVRELIYKATPQGRYVSARSVAAMTAFLLSEDAADITGQAINVSCGIGDY